MRGCDGRGTKVKKAVLAIAAHPDDIEFVMGGTLILLGRSGYELHYMNIANGSCGTPELSPQEIVAIRAEEARAAAEMIAATFHPPLVNDFEIYYEPTLLARLAAVLRQVDPRILLLPSPQDYMEDHVNAARLGVTAGFVRSMPNFVTRPATPPVRGQLAVYHAMPLGLTGPLRKPAAADLYVDISSALDQKRQMLACHRSQKDWLDRSQGIGSYIQSMEETSARVGALSGRWAYAEGWQRHSHLGFGAVTFDPLTEALGERVLEA